LFATVRRKRNGTFGAASWVNLSYPGNLAVSSNAVYGNQVVGIVAGLNGFAFQATVHA
jgi:hypothetical protein